MGNKMPLGFANEMLVLLYYLTATLENDNIIRILAICSGMTSKIKYRNTLAKQSILGKPNYQGQFGAFLLLKQH